MIYEQNEKLIIRTMIESDVANICYEETLQGWHASEEKYLIRLNDMKAGKNMALVAVYQNEVAGYINLYRINNKYEIVDFGVLEKFQRKGIGTKLMDVAETLAAIDADIVYLAVGLHSGYGNAQRMYIKRGYIPDGKGIYYGEKICAPYENYPNNDDLTLRFSKKLHSDDLKF